VDPDVSDQASLTDLFASLARLAGKLAPDSAAPAAPSQPAPPLPAFENYIKGLVAENPTAQAAFLDAAIKAFPGYDRAELALWNVRTGVADHVSALAAARAVPASSPLSRRAKSVVSSTRVNSPTVLTICPSRRKTRNQGSREALAVAAATLPC